MLPPIWFCSICTMLVGLFVALVGTAYHQHTVFVIGDTASVIGAVVASIVYLWIKILRQELE